MPTPYQLDRTRRRFLQGGAAVGALALFPGTATWAAPPSAARRRGSFELVLPLQGGWQFLDRTTSAVAHTDSASSFVTLPHCVAPLSWHRWDPASWESVYTYRHVFNLPSAFAGQRVFLHFDKVMAVASPSLNGHALPEHAGGFLPFEYEVTDLVQRSGNLLSVLVDSRWSNVPPAGSPKGPASVDYLLPGGICGAVELRAVPSIFIQNLFAKPVNALSPERRLEVTCTVNGGAAFPRTVRMVAALKDGEHTLGSASTTVTLNQPVEEISLTLSNLQNILLWHTDSPHLYRLVVTAYTGDTPIHAKETRVGFREAHFTLDGFFLNGKRLQLFGLNRHELYPYVGFAAPDRALRRDAEYLRKHLNCNMVRCSHYPQSEAFLDACDELGLLVWEETPGWQYIGDDTWQKLTLQNVADMVRRDRNHPSIVIWGVRINESANNPELYRRTRETARSLDDSRPTSGTMTPSSTKTWREGWHQDVFAFDDYHAAADGSVGISEPLPGVPYMIAEAVGQYAYGTAKNFSRKYRRAGNPQELTDQALLHAQAHDRAAAYPRCCGVLAWCAFDYASLLNDYEALKCPGIADTFRIPKLGASFYLAQIDPRVRIVLEPDFYWDFGPRTPEGPGERAAIFSNCEHLELFIDGDRRAVLKPDRHTYPNLQYPPFFVDLELSGAATPELRIEGYIAGKQAITRSFSSDPSLDRLFLSADEAEIQADGSDATRLVFAVVDKFGAPRPFATGEVQLQIAGPGILVGDNPFSLGESGGVGAVWIRSLPGHAGRIAVTATHTSLGTRTAVVQSRRFRG